MRLVVLALGLLLTGCASMPGLYAEVGAGFKIEPNTSYVMREGCDTVTLDGMTRSCGGDNPTAHFAVGFEFRNGRTRCEYGHFSHYLDGGSDRELHMDEGRCFHRWGGR
jgi:hypothetical protein